MPLPKSQESTVEVVVAVDREVATEVAETMMQLQDVEEVDTEMWDQRTNSMEVKMMMICLMPHQAASRGNRTKRRKI